MPWVEKVDAQQLHCWCKKLKTLKATVESSVEQALQFVTYVKSPVIRWVSLADVHRKKISSFAKFANDFFKVLHKSDKEWRSAATTKVKY